MYPSLAFSQLVEQERILDIRRRVESHAGRKESASRPAILQFLTAALNGLAQLLTL